MIKVWYDKKYWAISLKRTITNVVLNKMSEYILSDEIKEGDEIMLSIDENNNLIIER